MRKSSKMKPMFLSKYPTLHQVYLDKVGWLYPEDVLSVYRIENSKLNVVLGYNLLISE